MTRIILRALIVVLGVAIVGIGIYRFGTINRSSLPDYGTVASFNFTDQDGKPFGSVNLVGKTWIADFFFTRCMGPCPLLTTRMSELQKTLSRKEVWYVSFTVDPDFDQPAVLKKYAANYGANESTWKFLNAKTDEVVALIRNSFKLAIAPNSSMNPNEIDILHSTYFVLVDPHAHVRGFYDSTDPQALIRLRTDIKTL